jgi:protease I
MADQTLYGCKIAILITDGFERVEMTDTRQSLDEAGAETWIVSPKEDTVRGWEFSDWGDDFAVDAVLHETSPEDFDALLLPGGVINPDALRTEPDAVAFVKAFFEAGKPVASICHGPWTIINAGAARGRRMTSWPSLEVDLRNAGADWIDQETVVDRGLVTSRKPEDIRAFNREMIALFAGGRAQGRDAA